jgi:outer membrane protein OmpA-like peptidoglycan-associated protein
LQTSFISLDAVANLLTEVPSMVLLIEGHTDNVGSQQHNKKLSENRAKAVVDYLIAKGIGKEK